MQLNVPPMRLALIPDGEAGISDTLDLMAGLVRQYKKNPVIRTLAVALAAAAPGHKNWLAQITACYNWIRQNVSYVQDVTDVETLQIPLVTIQNGAGDCDDMVTALAAMLEAIGFHTRFVACGFHAPHEYEHVFLQAQLPDGSRWYSLDPTEPYGVGWSPPNILPEAIKIKDNTTDKSLLL